MLYGIEGTRTLELVATGLPSDIVSKQPVGMASAEDHPRNDHEEGDESHVGGAHPGASGG